LPEEKEKSKREKRGVHDKIGSYKGEVKGRPCTYAFHLEPKYEFGHDHAAKSPDRHPGGLHHFIYRGIERGVIFRDDAGREILLTGLAES
jgi:hypothetical protein